MVESTQNSGIVYKIVSNGSQIGQLRNLLGNRFNERDDKTIKIEYIEERGRRVGITLSGNNITEERIRNILLEKFKQENFIIRKGFGEVAQRKPGRIATLGEQVLAKTGNTSERIYTVLETLSKEVDYNLPKRKEALKGNNLIAIAEDLEKILVSKLDSINTTELRNLNLEKLFINMQGILGEDALADESFRDYSTRLLTKAEVQSKELAERTRNYELALQSIAKLSAEIYGYGLTGFDITNTKLDLEKYIPVVISELKKSKNQLEARAKLAEQLLSEQDNRIYKAVEIFYKELKLDVPDKKLIRTTRPDFIKYIEELSEKIVRLSTNFKNNR